MNPIPFRGRRHWLALAAATALLAAACGGGVSEQGTGAQPQVFASGPISGFGSIIVNGVHYDDSAVTPRDEDGATLSGGLQLGMVVAIDGQNLDRTALTATATAVTVYSELLGPVTARDDVAGTLTVLGQTVRLNPAPATDRAVAVGDIVQVYGLFDEANQRYTATRLQHRSGVNAWRIHGKVSQLTASTFQIGALTITYTQAPAGLADGAVLRLRLATTADGQGRYALQDAEAVAAVVPANGTEVELEGVISRYSALSSFVVQGLTIDASAATLEPAGSVLAVGVRIEAEGVMRGGVLRASKVEFKGTGEDSGGGSGGGTEVEITSTIDRVDTVANTLVLTKGSQLVDYSGAVFEDGLTELDLQVGVKLEVKGTLSADGTRVLATRLKKDN